MGKTGTITFNECRKVISITELVRFRYALMRGIGKLCKHYKGRTYEFQLEIVYGSLRFVQEVNTFYESHCTFQILTTTLEPYPVTWQRPRSVNYSGANLNEFLTPLS